MDFSQDLVRGTVVPVVLALLSDRPMYGYEMVKVVNARTRGAFEWREGTLYPALHRLEADGLVRSSWQAAATGKDRKYYAITRRGRAELARRSAEWKQFSAAVDAAMMGA